MRGLWVHNAVGPLKFGFIGCEFNGGAVTHSSGMS
jgi:hypothetical protein